MNKFVRNTKSAAGAFGRRAAKFGSKAAAAYGTSMAMVGAALASTPATVGEAAATGITAGKSQVDSVQNALIVVLIGLVVFSLIRRSFGK